MSEAPVATAIARFDDFEFDFESSELRKSGTPIRLQEQPAKILAILLQNSGRIITRDELRQAIWPAGTFVDFDHSLNTAIAKLRTALGDTAEAPRYVETVARHGYRFVGEVTHVEATPANGVALGPDEVTAAERGQVSRRAGLQRALTVGAAVVLLVVVAALLLRGNRESPAPPTPDLRTGPAPQRTIAVLPIANDDAESQYVSDGITVGMIDELSTSPALRVTALSSSMRYRDSKADPATIGRELGVSTIVTGAFHKEDENIALRLEMIDTRDGSQRWAKNYVYPSERAANMKRRVVADVSLRLGITGTERIRRVPSPEAYDLYLQGRYLWHLRGRQNILRAIDLFEQAIAIDPEFALAWSGLGNAYGVLAGNSLVPGREEETQKKSAAAIEKALALDDTLAEAWTSRAASKGSYHWDFEGADRDYRRALELNPSYSSAHQWYGAFLMNIGRPVEARQEIDLALQLDPFSLPANMWVCWNRFSSRHYDEAIEHARRAQTTDPALRLGPCVVWSHAMKGDYEAAIRTVRNARPDDADALAAALQRDGTRGFWRRRAQQMNGYAYTEAACYALAGDRDEAFDSLERAYAARQSDVPGMYVDPRMDPLRADPRFEELARRVGLPQVKAVNTR
ncbi:MAG: winged helix-turn-helix domain-containing tetratricopeptide repeat protein [Thermoanaerobaculia bacterium]